MIHNQKNIDSLKLKLIKLGSNHGDQKHGLDTTNQAKIQTLTQSFIQ